ncbi:thiol reductant ABC exporter subunit CydC [Streptomyces physcomitrii]|uniref:thiol reductant ABC exporter subunit CydC n=1 Tax=Streptomyces physcomitrii TaxID=2724184 RepID=UPI00341DE7D3
MFHVKPIDPRLLRHARATRLFLILLVLLGAAGAGLLIAQATLLAEIVVGAFQDGLSARALRTPLLLLLAVALGRGAVGWLTELAAHRASAAAKSELRGRLLGHAGQLGPDRIPGQDTGSLVVLATRGVDALDDYFARYLPQLALAVVVPVAVLARIVTEDWISAAVIAGTLPLIPVFMVLIGWATQSRTDRQWQLLARLSGHFLDVVAGLPTLKVFGRAKAQAESIRRITGDYRRATMRTLRIAFLSSFALELLATLSVALVAVGIGMRLVHGELGLYAGLVILILAPEAYLPLRQVGAQFHAAAEGLSAAENLFAVLETPLPEAGAGALPVGGAGSPSAAGPASLSGAVPPSVAGATPLPVTGTASLPATGTGSLSAVGTESLPASGTTEPLPSSTRTVAFPPGELRCERVTVRYPGRSAPAVEDVSLTVRPGEVVALTGPSGCGKSTLLRVLLGLVRPAEGRVSLAGTDLAGIAPARWHEQIAWVPQHPQLYAGTLAENIRLARPEATEAEVHRALADAGALDFTEALPEGLGTRLGEDGAGLSAGQRQRLALARAFLADRPVLLLDEPTAALDGATEEEIVASIRRLATGRTVLLVVHRPALLALADRVVRLDGAGEAGQAHEAGGTSGAGPGIGTGQATAIGQVADVAPLAQVTDAGEIGEAAHTGQVADAGEIGEAAHTGQVAEVGEISEAAHRSRLTERRGAARRAGAQRRPPPLRPLARLRALARVRRARLGLALLLGALALGSAVGLMATSGWLISRASEQPPVLYLMVAVTATRAFGIGRAVFRYGERLVAHEAVLRMLADTRVAVFRRLEALAPAGLRRTRRGDLLSRLVADVDALQDYWLRWLLPTGAAVLVGGLSAGFSAWLLPEAGAVLAAGLLLAGAGVPLLAAALARRTERRLAPARGALATRVTDLLTGTAELTVAGALGSRTAAARGADAELTRIASRAAAVTALGNGLTALLCGLTLAATAPLGVAAVGTGRLDGVQLAVVLLLPLAAFECVLGMPVAMQYRQRVRASARRVYEVLDAPEPVPDPVPEAPAPASPFPLRLRGLTARHEGAGRDALGALDLTLREGRRIAVVGPSGSGKTTLAQVLLRFVDVRDGSYTLGGTDVRELSGDTVRETVGLCAQDAHLFDSSLRENLLLARKGATEEEVRGALAAARLLDWVDSLPRGIDTLVGEHGRELSGGQRQRLALARALLAAFPVLVLDEPAEHLDLETADALTRDLLTATEGRTTVLITHRLAGLEAVDEVLVLDEGRLVQRGRYADLLARPGPLRRMRERESAADLLTPRPRPRPPSTTAAPLVTT